MLRFKKETLLALLNDLADHTFVHLVHDDGVYIMCLEQPVGSRTIVYAEGCNPHIDADHEETSRNLVGGDDFGEPLMTAGDLKANLQGTHSGIAITVGETQFIIDGW